MEFREQNHPKKWNRLLDAVVTIIKYNKITIDNDIYIKVLSDGTVSYITVYTDNLMDTTNNVIAYTELRRGFEEIFEIKFQEVYVIKYLNFQISSLLLV